MESPLPAPPESIASVSPLTDASGVSGRAWQPSQHLPPPATFLFPSCQPSVNPTTWHPLQEFCFHPVCTSSLPHHLQTGACGSGLSIQCPSGAPQPRAPPPILQLSTLTKPACGGGRASWNQTLPVRRAILHGAGGSCRWRVGGAEPDPGPVLGPALSPLLSRGSSGSGLWSSAFRAGPRFGDRLCVVALRGRGPLGRLLGPACFSLLHSVALTASVCMWDRSLPLHHSCHATQSSRETSNVHSLRPAHGSF